jgi:hypothetical protein
MVGKYHPDGEEGTRLGDKIEIGDKSTMASS